MCSSSKAVPQRECRLAEGADNTFDNCDALPWHGLCGATLLPGMVCNCKGVLHQCNSTLCEAAAGLCGARPHMRPAARATHSARSATHEKVV